MEEKTFNLTQIVTGVTCCAFLLGILYPVVYYSFFSFNVFDYIEFNEIVTHIIKVAFIILLPFLLYLLITTNIPKSVVINNKFLNKPFWSTKSIVATILFWSTAILFFTYFSYLLYIKKISLPKFLSNSLSFLWVIYIVKLPSAFKRLFETTFNININSFYYILIFAVVTTIFEALVQSLDKVDSVNYQHNTIGSYIIRTKDTIESTKSYYYIGKTNKFVFFYNEKKDMVTVYPESTIKEYSLKDY